jgi:hypothetical protein
MRQAPVAIATMLFNLSISTFAQGNLEQANTVQEFTLNNSRHDFPCDHPSSIEIEIENAPPAESFFFGFADLIETKFDMKSKRVADEYSAHGVNVKQEMTQSSLFEQISAVELEVVKNAYKSKEIDQEGTIRESFNFQELVMVKLPQDQKGEKWDTLFIEIQSVKDDSKTSQEYKVYMGERILYERVNDEIRTNDFEATLIIYNRLSLLLEKSDVSVRRNGKKSFVWRTILK